MLRQLHDGTYIFECNENERTFINEVMTAAERHGMTIMQFEYTDCDFILLKFCKKGCNEREWCIKRGSPRCDCNIDDEEVKAEKEKRK